MRLSAVILLLSLGFATSGRAQTPAIQTKIDNQLNLKRLQGAFALFLVHIFLAIAIVAVLVGWGVNADTDSQWGRPR